MDLGRDKTFSKRMGREYKGRRGLARETRATVWGETKGNPKGGG